MSEDIIKTIAIRIPRSIATRLKITAICRRSNVSALVREAVELWWSQQPENPAPSSKQTTLSAQPLSEDSRAHIRTLLSRRMTLHWIATEVSISDSVLKKAYEGKSVSRTTRLYLEPKLKALAEAKP